MSKYSRIILALLMAIVLVAGTGISAKPAQAAGCSSYHTVRPGETLSSIARWYGAYWPHLAQINNIPGPRYKIFSGQVLCIAFGSTGGRDNYYPPYNNYYPNTNPYGYAVSGLNWSFGITSVQLNTSVTIRTANFPSNVLFKAKIGRRSGNGIVWADLPNIDSGNGGSFEVVFTIPAEFKNVSQLAVRVIQEKKNGKVFHQDQWFSNTTFTNSGSGGRGIVNDPWNYGYYRGAIPTIWISSVVRDTSVTIRTANFPPNLDFQVLMGPMGTRGHGYYVTTFNSGAGGVMNLTFAIPPQLYGSRQISIRTQNQWSGHFSYNWFYNNTAY